MDPHSRDPESPLLGLSKRQRDIGGAVGLVLLLFGWFTLWRFPGESWQDTYATPIILSVALLGMRWAPERGQLSMTMRARRARAWVGLVLLLAVFPALAWMHGSFDGFFIGAFMLVVGVLFERWGLSDFKFTDLFGDSQKSSVPRQREDV